jgi:Na+/proline symporter
MKKIIATIAAFVPAIAGAQVINDVNSLSYKLTNLGNLFLQLLMAFAVIWIVFNVIRFIMADDENRKTYRTSIIWGIVGLAVALSIWGLVRILTNSFRTDTNTPTNQFPQVNYPNQIP